MVYGYDTNEEFIDTSNKLLKKLEKKGLWNKDTLIVGMGKSVRPLAYSLRQLSKKQDKETPDTTFLNYDRWGGKFESENLIKRCVKEIQEKVNLKKIGNKYKRLLILDEYAYSGRTIREAREILKKSFSNQEVKPKIFSATISKDPGENLPHKDHISVDTIYLSKALPEEKGVEDKYDLPEGGINESTPIKNAYFKEEFLMRRRQLSNDIDKYLQKKHSERISDAKNLESFLSIIIALSFLVGVLLCLPLNNLTGGVIGNPILEGHKLIGIILIVLAIAEFFIYKKFK